MTNEQLDNLPNEMLKAKRWLVWKSIPNKNPQKKPRKVPYYANGKMRGEGIELDSTADRAQFGTFDDALTALKGGKYAGIGFALGPDSTGNVWQGIDLDDIATHPELQPIADDLPGYTEQSPSGKGMHAIGYGKPFAVLCSNSTGIEAYSRARYFTVTGESAGINPPTCIADFVVQRLKPIHTPKKSEEPNSRDGIANGDTPTNPDQVLITDFLPAQTVADLRSALLHLRSDDYEQWINNGIRLKSLGEVGRGLWLEHSSTSPLFDLAEASAKWDTFKPTKTGYRAVFAEAQRRGWVNPSTHHESPPEADSDLLARLSENIIGIDTVAANSDLFLPHYVDLWVPFDEVTLLAGHGGGGKSYVALSIAVHVALGLPFGPHDTTQASVLFFSGEDGAKVLRQRLWRICAALNIQPSALDGLLHLLDASDIDPALHREQRVNINGRQQIITETPLLNALADLVTERSIGLVVIDNASDAYDDDEIKRARVRAFVRSLRSHIARPGRAVLLLAHINKASAIGGRSAGAEDYSGSTAWHNSVRSRLSLIPDGDNALTIEHLKANLGAKSAPVRLEWHHGVPMVAGSYTDAGAEAAAAIRKAAEQERDAAHKMGIVEVIKDCDKRGERVTTAMQGSATAYHLLSKCPSYPKGIGRDFLPRLLRELENEGRIFRRTVRTPDRKYRETFTCTPIPQPDGQLGGQEVPISPESECAN